MPLDEMPRRNLELVESMRGGEVSGTLLTVLDRTLTPMGARLLRHWLLAPLISRVEIEQRLDAVSSLSGLRTREALREGRDGVRDVERLGGKAAAGRASPRELRALGDSLRRVPDTKTALERTRPKDSDSSWPFSRHINAWDDCGDLCSEIQSILVERPPVAIGDEPTIRTGVDADLDSWRGLRDGGKDGIAKIQAEERTRTGISSIKVGYNKVFGYFIEVTNSNKHLAPADYQRRQTLTRSER